MPWAMGRGVMWTEANVPVLGCSYFNGMNHRDEADLFLFDFLPLFARSLPFFATGLEDCPRGRTHTGPRPTTLFDGPRPRSSDA